jgi:hypothetical protein
VTRCSTRFATARSVAYKHFNLHGDFDFSLGRMVDSVGLWSPKDPSPKGH